MLADEPDPQSFGGFDHSTFWQTSCRASSCLSVDTDAFDAKQVGITDVVGFDSIGYGNCSRATKNHNGELAVFDLTYASTEALLSGLLATCDETATIAQRLAARAREESLRTLLQERAASYRSAARELRRNGGTLGVETEAADPIDGVGELACVEPVWEAIECSALICFRDALDGELPPELQPVVRRWIADGVSALERLRATRPA